jgi:hypothetical protein
MAAGSDRSAREPFGNSKIPYSYGLFKKLTVYFGFFAGLAGVLGIAGLVLGIPFLASVYPGYKTIALSAALMWIVLGAVLAASVFRPLKGFSGICVQGLLILIAVAEAIELPLNLSGSHSLIEAWFVQTGIAVYGPSSTPVSPIASALILLSAVAMVFVLRVPESGSGSTRNIAGITGMIISIVSFTFVLNVVNASWHRLQSAPDAEAYQREVFRLLDAAAEGVHPNRRKRRSFPRAAWHRRHTFPARKESQ